MKNNSSSILKRGFPVQVFIVIAMIVCVTFITSSFTNNTALVNNPEAVNKDSIESVQAFKTVYKVLMSPRCMNCHPSGDVPLQGDSSLLHTMAPKRGKEGKGLYAMKCANCHQPENTEGLHAPPGNPNWHLPPADMKMVFQGRTARQLAKQLIDPNQNGHKDKQKLIEHADDGLVLAGWNPGDGRTLPPVSHAVFKKAWLTWINKGMYAPGGK